jgi:hypothetical protein
MALVCNCSLAGTEACKSCGRYIEAFGKSEQDNPFVGLAWSAAVLYFDPNFAVVEKA